MLHIMRKHAGWGLKVILGIIIVTFVFFFGFNKIREQNREAAAIQVGKDEISFSQYRFFYDNQYEKLRETFKNAEIPDYFVKSIQEATKQQLVTRTLIRQFAESLRITVTDKELAEIIVKEKDFDPVEYKNFLSNFYSRHAFSYEDLVREDTLVQKFQNWAQKAEKTAESPDQTVWTFETVSVIGEDKRLLAEELQQAWANGKDIGTLLKKNNLKAEKVGPIALQDRHKLFQGASLSPDEYFTLFSLTKPKSAPSKAIEKNKRFMVARLLERKSPADKKTEEASTVQIRLVDVWFREFANKSKVQSFIKSEEL